MASELGVHPASDDRGGEPWSTSQHHEISLMCDDIESTVAERTAKGAEFTGEITGRGFGLTTALRVPGAGKMMIYQPHHPTAHDLQDSPTAVRHIYALVDNIDS